MFIEKKNSQALHKNNLLNIINENTYFFTCVVPGTVKHRNLLMKMNQCPVKQSSFYGIVFHTERN